LPESGGAGLVERFARVRKGVKPGPETLKELIEDGRR